MKIAAVIVTYNRVGLLKEVLEAFDNQTQLPEYVIVVDNASTDGTDSYLKEWEMNKIGNEKIVISNSSNIGGSGGFYIGTEKAMETDADWIWVSDDDAIPDLDVFEKAKQHIRDIKNLETVSAICTSVWTKGKIALSNRSKRIQGILDIKLEHIKEEEYQKTLFECNNFSYVGVLMNKEKLKKVGLIKKEYFIWRDDVEHSWRLSKAGSIYCFPDMKVNHKIKDGDYKGITWKSYYGYRNDIQMLKDLCPRRYYVFKVIKVLIRGMLSGKVASYRLYMDAIKAGVKGEKSINHAYLPETWKYEI